MSKHESQIMSNSAFYIKGGRKRISGLATVRTHEYTSKSFKTMIIN